jgi:hypothetical protein
MWIIKLQLMPLKDVLINFPAVILDNTNQLTLLEKHSTTIIEPATNEPHPPSNNLSFIPRSVQIKLELK